MPPDPPAQFHAALLATRAALLAQNTTASSASAVALAALAVAGAGAADCQNHLSSAQASFAVATFLDRALREASFAAANLAAAAEGAHAKAAAAATAMSAAATSIAAMGATFEQLLSTLNGVAAVATSNAEEDPIARAAKNVLTTFRSIGASVEELSYLSLQATIESARPATALAAQATRAGQARLPELLSSVEAGLKNAGAALAAAQNARASAMAALFEQSHARAAAAAEAAGLSSAIDGLDEICNQSLTAAVHNVPRGGDPQGTAGLRAAWKFSDSVAAHTAAFTLYAVPLADVPGFDFAAAVANHHGVTVEFPRVSARTIAPKPPADHADLLTDSNGQPIAFGRSYAVFGLRRPAPEAGPQNALHLSLPTLPVAAAVQLAFAAAPVAFALPGGAFVVWCEAAAPTGSVRCHRLFLVPADALEGGGVELSPPGRLAAASYAACEVNAAALAPPTAPDPHALACAIHRELAAEHGMDSTCAPGRPASSDSDGLENWLQLHAARLRSGCLVLCSPTATKIGLQSAGYAIGTYTDIYGNLLDLETRRYRALVLAVGAVDAQGNALAAEALSPPSQIFPPFAAG